MAGDLRSNRNEIIKLVTAFWAGAAAVAGTSDVSKLVIADIDNDGNPDAEPNPGAGGNKLPFARMRIQHTTGQSTSISGRRYRNDGVLTVNLFVNRTKTDAWLKAGELGQALKVAIRKSRGNVSFKNVALRERPINNGFNQVDVVADFYWTEFHKPGA